MAGVRCESASKTFWDFLGEFHQRNEINNRNLCEQHTQHFNLTITELQRARDDALLQATAARAELEIEKQKHNKTKHQCDGAIQQGLEHLIIIDKGLEEIEELRRDLEMAHEQLASLFKQLDQAPRRSGRKH